MDKTVANYLERLENLPFIERAHWVSMRSATPVSAIHLTVEGKKVALPVSLTRSHLTKELGERLVHLAKERKGLLVLAPVVGRELGALFEREGVNFMDLAGNCYVRLGSKFVARVQGQRVVARTAETTALRPAGYRVLFALLADDAALNATARELATLAGGVSPQTSTSVRGQLVAAGHLIERRSTREWAPGGYARALEIFVAGFGALARAMVIGRYRHKATDPREVERALAPRLASIGAWAWGGGAACERLTGHYRGDRTVVYAAHLAPDAAKRLGLVPSDDGPVTLAIAPGPPAFHGRVADTVHPLLVYVDLLTEGHDRAREAAAEIHQRYLTEPPR